MGSFLVYLDVNAVSGSYYIECVVKILGLSDDQICLRRSVTLSLKFWNNLKEQDSSRRRTVNDIYYPKPLYKVYPNNVWYVRK